MFGQYPRIYYHPKPPKAKNVVITFNLCEDEPLEDEFLGFRFEEEGEVDYFPELEELTMTVITGHGRVMELRYSQFWINYFRVMFPEGSVDVFRSLRTLRVPRDWDLVMEEGIRPRFPPQVQIIYIPEDEE